MEFSNLLKSNENECHSLGNTWYFSMFKMPHDFEWKVFKVFWMTCSYTPEGGPAKEE